MPEQGDLARQRIARVFRFLQAFHQVRNPVPRAVSEQWHFWLDSVPATEFTSVARISDAEGEDDLGDDPGLVLRVRRPKLTECPAPPAVLDGWLQDGWRAPAATVKVVGSRRAASDTGTEESFVRSAPRVEALKRWEAQRADWARREKPAREADQLFQTLYGLHGQLQRESERFELVLGDGNLVWQRPDGDAHYPVVLQAVQLEFDPDKPEFRVVETDREVELYSSLLSCFEEVDARRIGECRDEVTAGGIHPLLGEVTNGFLKRLALTMSGRGTLAGTAKPEPSADPQFYRRPVLFLRPRAVGFARVLESILADVEGGADIPLALQRIVGVENPATGDGRGHLAESDVLLSKEANPEQVQIVQRLHDHGSVLVQGPPGTGKSHTIANLIGHLLAHGKSVLVTSHTTKALKVLRTHVVEDLRPLCVSVLDSDVESRRELEVAVTNIAGRLARSDREKLKREADGLHSERAKILDALKEARASLREARRGEQREITVAGTSYSPCEAARIVAAGAKQESWIPGPVSPGAALPLTSGEVEELYRTNGSVTPADEHHLAEPLPDTRALALPSLIDELLRALRAPVDHEDARHLWARGPSETDTDSAVQAAELLATEAMALEAADGWQQDVALAGMGMGGAAQPWEAFAAQAEAAARLQADAAELFVRYEVVLPTSVAPEDAERTANELLAHAEQHGGVGVMAKLANRAWAAFLKQSTVSGSVPKTLDHYRALKAAASLARLRFELERRWKRLFEPGGAPAWGELGPHPESDCSQFVPEIRRLLAWKRDRVDPVLDRLRAAGFLVETFMQNRPHVTGERAELRRMLQALVRDLPEVVQGRVEAAARDKNVAVRAAVVAALESGPAAGTRLQRMLAEAVSAGDERRYRATYDHVAALRTLQGALARRLELLARLQTVAPGWTEAIRQRSGCHGQNSTPGSPTSAWLWLQLHSELERRAAESLPELQARVERLEKQARDITVKLIDRRAWSKQMERTSLAQQQALVGWLDLVRRVGKGTGKRAPLLRAEAAKQMKECRTAVPVWIMPLARVAEMFDSGTKFDVVIIDEASQSDVMGLVALYLGSKVVVVGDHEQVSPTAVGQQLNRVGNLIVQHLGGVPNSALYDGKTSMYDLARQSFGGLIRLTEHFRCYPEIIEFSNHLSYDGEIKPLREPFGATVRPFVVPFRVEGATREDDVNLAEARRVAALLVACAHHPEYDSKTFGVVSLLGDDQAMVIDKLVREHLPEAEYVARRVLCGNAAHFQGDERDVMFLSLVHAPEDGPLSLLTDTMYQQRFNVAASRARDQMWVVHSLDPNKDLKPKDLRRRLIEHALDPMARARELERKTPKTESDFEKKVLERLVGAGFRVHPQYSVGAYRIDFVVEGATARLAVECDGDRFHTPENLDEDMARQAILERLGWKFVRIRGSVFYRDPDRAMRPVFDRLSELGVEPGLPQVQEPRSSELQGRVLAKADALLHEWGMAPASSPTQLGVVPEVAPEPVHRGTSTTPPHERVPRAAEPIGTVLRLPFGEAAQPGVGVSRVDEWQAIGLPTSTVSRRNGAAPIAVAGNHSAGANKGDLSRKELFLQILAKQLDEELPACPICAGELKLRLSTFGPYLPCKKPGCGGKHSVDQGKVKATLTELGFSCECGGTLVLKRGKSTFLGCDRYPACDKTVWWRDL